MTEQTRKKIAVLGSGAGAMTTVFHLTNTPNWQELYEITVYQMGWRLGGKGASGRGENGRIEEHGPHIWYGFYENSFKMMQACYQELGRKPGEPLSIWEEAFKPLSFTIYEEDINGQWDHWPVTFPTNNAVPGQGGEFPTVGEYVVMLFQEMGYLLQNAKQPPAPGSSAGLPMAVRVLPWWSRLIGEVKEVAEDSAYAAGLMLLAAAGKIAAEPEKYGRFLPGDGSSTVTWLLDHFKSWLWGLLEKLLDQDPNLRHIWILLDLATSIVRGLIADDVAEKGLASLNHLDFAEWLLAHGLDKTFTLPFVYQNLYDQAFAYENGDPKKPNCAAGVVLHVSLRLYFTYKGAFQWRMIGGMGDVVFAPFYQVLKQRGVKFEFFHKVEDLHVENGRISRISMTQQATLKDEYPEYRPLVPVKRLPCWPSHPRYQQLKEGDELKGVDLESYWTTWQGKPKTLTLGQEFDFVLLGISLGGIPYTCQELINTSSSWQKMVQHVKTIPTQAVQLWMKPDAAGLGWLFWKEQAATVNGYDITADPNQSGLDSWSDFSHVIPKESWPDAHYPNYVAYICGALTGGDGLHLPPPQDVDYPHQQQERVKQNALFMLKNHVGYLWPRAVQAANPNALNWELLIDPQNGVGEARLDAQYIRANVEPSGRYVLSVADSVQHRLHPANSGFDNLYLAGDWTYNGLMSIGCVESAVMGGMQAANGILQRFGLPPVEIIGWAE